LTEAVKFVSSIARDAEDKIVALGPPKLTPAEGLPPGELLRALDRERKEWRRVRARLPMPEQLKRMQWILDALSIKKSVEEMDPLEFDTMVYSHLDSPEMRHKFLSLNLGMSEEPINLASDSAGKELVDLFDSFRGRFGVELKEESDKSHFSIVRRKWLKMVPPFKPDVRKVAYII
jgi:hypothetical protein